MARAEYTSAPGAQDTCTAPISTTAEAADTTEDEDVTTEDVEDTVEDTVEDAEDADAAAVDKSTQKSSQIVKLQHGNKTKQ